MSTHAINVYKLKEILPHPMADNLQIVQIEGWTCCIRKDQFRSGQLVAYVPPDYVVDTNRPEFAFLADNKNNLIRIKVRKLRQVVSQGLVIPAPEGASEGDNVIDQLGITRWEPLEPAETRGECTKGPNLVAPKYDLENYQNYRDLIIEGEEVILTEKIHGANLRAVYHNGTQYMGSRTEWKADSESNLWWIAYRQNPWLKDFCEKNPDIIVYGEVYGRVGGFNYNLPKNKYGIAVFDLYKDGKFMDYDEAVQLGSQLQWAPVLHRGTFSATKAAELAEGQTVLGNGQHIKEGIVLGLPKERLDLKIGRVKLKLVSNEYLMR